MWRSDNDLLIAPPSYNVSQVTVRDTSFLSSVSVLSKSKARKLVAKRKSEHGPLRLETTTGEEKKIDLGRTQGGTNASGTNAVKVMCHKSSSAVHLESRQKRATAENFSMKTIDGVKTKGNVLYPLEH